MLWQLCPEASPLGSRPLCRSLCPRERRVGLSKHRQSWRLLAGHWQSQPLCQGARRVPGAWAGPATAGTGDGLSE